MVNMRGKLLYIGVIILFFSGCLSNPNAPIKDFNGTITYKLSIDCKNGETPHLETHRKEMGDTLKIYFRGSKYYMRHNGIAQTEEWYDNNTGTQYGLMGNKDTLYVDNCEKSVWRLDQATKLDKKETILGRKCQSFLIESNNTETIYFYDPSISIEPSRYDKHGFGFVNLYYQNCKAPYLKRVRTSQVCTYTYLAVHIDTTMPPGTFFDVPLNLPKASLIGRLK